MAKSQSWLTDWLAKNALLLLLTGVVIFDYYIFYPTSPYLDSIMFLLPLIMLRLSQILLSSLPPTWPNICVSFQLHMTQWSPNHSPASTYFPETVFALLQSDKIVTRPLSCVIESKILRIGNEESQFYLIHNLQIVPLTLLSLVTLMFHSVLFISVSLCVHMPFLCFPWIFFAVNVHETLF